MRLTTFSCDGLTAGTCAGRFACFLRRMRTSARAVMIFKHGWIEFRRFRPDDVLRELHHLGRKLHQRNLAEIILCAAHFVRKTQRHAAKSRTHGLDQKRPLARGQHHAGKADDALAAHRVTDNREGFLPDLLARHDVVRLLEISCVDLPRRKEALDLDRTRVLWTRDRSDLPPLHHRQRRLLPHSARGVRQVPSTDFRATTARQVPLRPAAGARCAPAQGRDPRPAKTRSRRPRSPAPCLMKPQLRR